MLDSLIARPVEMLPMLLGVEADEVRRGFQSAIELPAFRPPVRRLETGPDGHALLELNTASPDSAHWLLFSRDGSLRGRVALPSDVDPRHLDATGIWAVDPDELEVPWLVRYRFGAGGDG